MTLWGGNYEGEPDRAFWVFNASFPFDRRLLPQEIAASRAYARALSRCGVLSQAATDALDKALGAILERAGREPGFLDNDAEDVHSFVESRLAETLGDLA